MDNLWLHFLNYFFFIFHTSLIVFNLIGWLFHKTRKLHFITLAITLFSWTVLGIWYGFGYCFLTDWHYEVLRKLGKSNLPHSYISFLIESFSGWQPASAVVELATVALTILILVCSVWVNFIKK